MTSMNGRETVYFYLNAAMGDMLYLLAACRAVKKQLDVRIIMIGQPAFHALIHACPHVAEVWLADALSAEQIQQLNDARSRGRFVNFTHWHHALTPGHMIDSFLGQIAITAAGKDKQLDLRIPAAAREAAAKFYEQYQLDGRHVILMHPNIGHPNRTWPEENWHQLAMLWIETGWAVIYIGSNHNSEAGKSMPAACPDGVINATDRFTALETIALMEKAHMLVSCDSGPVMLAAATNIPVTGLYSTVASAQRMPFRDGILGSRFLGIDLACEFGPCARHLQNESLFVKKLQRPFDVPTTQEFSQWCLNENSYRCLHTLKASELYHRMLQFFVEGDDNSRR